MGSSFQKGIYIKALRRGVFLCRAFLPFSFHRQDVSSSNASENSKYGFRMRDIEDDQSLMGYLKGSSNWHLFRQATFCQHIHPGLV